MQKKSFYSFICIGMNSYQTKLKKNVLGTMWLDFDKWQKQSPAVDSKKILCLFIRDYLQNNYNYLRKMDELHTTFINEYDQAITVRQQQSRIIDYCLELGATRQQISKDIKAFSRYFDYDAVIDRYQKIVGDKELQVDFALERWKVLFCQSPDKDKFLYNELQLINICELFLDYNRNQQLRLKAFDCLLGTAIVFPDALQTISSQIIHFLYRCALERDEYLWLQCLAIEYLPFLSDAKTLASTLLNRFLHPGKGDDFFVRRRAVEVFSCNAEKLNEYFRIMNLIVKDDSSSVRQEACLAIRFSPVNKRKKYFHKLIFDEDDAAVKAKAILTLGELVDCEQSLEMSISFIQDLLFIENDPFVLKTTMYMVKETALRLKKNNSLLEIHWIKQSRYTIDNYHNSAPDTYLKRWSSNCLEYLWCLSDRKRYDLLLNLQTHLSKIPLKKSKTFSKKFFLGFDKIIVARVIAVITQNDYNYDVHWGFLFIRITRGYVFKMRWWRILHEFKTPAPDKRPAFRHTVARVSSATCRIPSNINCELSPTKVPGEPLFIDEEQGWRPYLPLVDDILSANNCFLFRKTYIHTNEGVTCIAPPRFLIMRIWAYAFLTIKFTKYASLRNWKENMQSKPNEYLSSLAKLGFHFDFQSHLNNDLPQRNDSSILRFFPCIVLIIDPIWWKNLEEFFLKFQQYFFSAYSNTVIHLVVFIFLCALWFFGLHICQNISMSRARNKIPLVLGGWGTRGKSGTERVKAALINSTGHSLVSKTTGCEAMFLYSLPFGQTEEIFLFRPYDKATIWEQYNLVHLSEKLESDVFLWECMALNPAYVKVLQSDWMRDDLSTITNTYPDHEDVQGPSGMDVAETISVFTPDKSKVIVSEEQMTPLLRETAKKKNTEFRSIGWLEAGLIPKDVLSRFPYNEHSYNIALVLEIAKELGIPYDYAIKEMADRVIADIGVLKTYPPAPVKNRQLEFTNGMSANERLGALGNWKRLGLDKQDIYNEPHVWVTTVVNNRADRIPRSKVFARILVRDIRADRHFLIGNNLDGLLSYIDEEWKEYIGEIYLCPQDNTSSKDALEILEKMAKEMRVSYTSEHVRNRLRAMIGEKYIDLWEKVDDLQHKLQHEYENYEEIIRFHNSNIVALQEYQQLHNQIHSSARPKEHQKKFREQLYTWFKRKIVVIENYSATGNQVIEKICQQTAPGTLNKIIGLQNIKGTGLDFVYRWQAWENCYLMCNKMLSKSSIVRNEGIQQLLRFKEYGVLTHDHVTAVICEQIEKNSEQQKDLNAIKKNVQEYREKINKELYGVSQKKSSMFSLIFPFIEAFLDAGDAIKRRKKADKIYKDLKHHRISIKRAIIELQSITKRQKGGWLTNK
ncbi:hypothetical protein [Candidatus Uabimicrobium sp. HlEnr_7]|uniref:hypothetical protein n=1 Tax=Candidatus Uabimicrobium helgolandensis TaxID=3095367 RepID=UPI00355842B7